MPIILAIAILVFIFKGGIFIVFEWLFYGIVAVFQFFVSIFDSIRTKRYQNQNEKARQIRLKNIDKAYKEKDYQRVVALFREVMKDRDYLNMETMKYCHIAADAVCHIAKTIPEYEEARTWTQIISFRDSYYKKETEDLHREITAKAGQTLHKHQELHVDAFHYVQWEEYDKAKQLLGQLADQGSLDALMVLAGVCVQTIDGFEAADTAEALLDRLDAIEPNLSQEFRNSFNEHPVVKFSEHTKKATEYENAAKNQSGMDYINTMLKSAKELEKAYDIFNMAVLTGNIARVYFSIALQYVDGVSTTRFAVEKSLEYANIALKWIKTHENEEDPERDELDQHITDYIATLEKELEQ